MRVGLILGKLKSLGSIMTLHRLSLAGLLLLCSSIALSEVLDPRRLAAVDVSNGMKLYWASIDETGIAGYMIERKAGANGSFIPLISQMKRAEGNGRQYSFSDETAFRTTGTFYQYRITPVNAAGAAVGSPYYVSGTKNNVSSVRRTWGSIKAMFR